MRHIVFLTGAGMSEESGLQTFRGAGGLWEGHPVEEVATPKAWASNPERVMRFYNERRRALIDTKPHDGHKAIAEMESISGIRVSIITQNVDDLHERAGSSNVLHLHGELRWARSTGPSETLHKISGWELKTSACCPEGFPLRPHVVWFGEEVPAMSIAWDIMATADQVVVVGTSLRVYPAAGLLDGVPAHAKILVIDPHADELPVWQATKWKVSASQGCRKYFNHLIDREVSSGREQGAR